MKSRFLMILVVGMLLVPALAFGGFIDNGGGGGVTGLTSVTGTLNRVPYFDTATTLAASPIERNTAEITRFLGTNVLEIHTNLASDYVFFGNSGQTTTNYRFAFSTASGTAINAPTGQTIQLRINNTDVGVVSGTAFTLSQPLNFSTDTGIRRDAAGSLSFTNGSTGHATGLGLGTATPLTIAGTASAVTAAMHVAVTGAAGIVASGTTSAQLLAVDTDAAANAKVISLRSVGGVGSITRFADNFGSVVDYLSANLATDVVTLGSASVAGVNYISGTGNHLFTDGLVQFGGATSSFPAIRQSSTQIDFILADASNWASIQSGTHRISNSGALTIDASDGTANLVITNAGNSANPVMKISDNVAGKALNVKQITELHTLAAAGTSDTTIQFPANALILGVAVRVTTGITGCATFQVGDSGSATRYGTGLALAAGTTNQSGGTTNPTIPGAAQSIRFTCVGGGASFTAGVVRVAGYYIDMTAPTSMLPALDMMRQIAAADPQLRRAA